MFEWLDPRGRASNAEYVRAALYCSLLSAPAVALLAFDGVPDGLRLVAVGVLWLVTLVMWPVAVRRVHDEDYAAHHAFWWMGGPTILLVTWITLPAFGVIPPVWLLWLSFVVAVVCCHVGLYAVAQAHDGARPNRYGPPTLQKPSLEERRRYRELSESTR